MALFTGASIIGVAITLGTIIFYIDGIAGPGELHPID